MRLRLKERPLPPGPVPACSTQVTVYLEGPGVSVRRVAGTLTLSPAEWAELQQAIKGSLLEGFRSPLVLEDET